VAVRICLVAVHRRADFIPLAPLYLKASLVERAGVSPANVDIVEFPHTSSAVDVAARIVELAPDIVGLSCYVWNIVTFRAVAPLVRAAMPGVTIVLGGPEVGPLAISTLEANPSVDVVVKGEGEIPFAQIVDNVGAGRPLADVRGIAYRTPRGVVDTGDASILTDLNVLPSPHTAAYASEGKRIACIETQRGCVFRCNFCFYNKDLSIRNRRFDLERVKAEIDFWIDRDAAVLYLMDPVFNLYADRAKEICAYIAARNHRRIPIHAEVWAEFIDEELARLMRDANFAFLEVGLQTTDSSVLMTVERRLKLQKFVEGVGFLRQHNLRYQLQLIYGLPGETVASFRRSLAFAVSLMPPDLAVFMLMVLPGTELWHKAHALRLAFDDTPPYYVQQHPTMSATEMLQGWKIIAALEQLWSATTVQLLARESPMAFLDLMDQWIERDGERSADGIDTVLQPLLLETCASHGISPDFYAACWASEHATQRQAETT
jgi:anaerobic magnesium-protoporphyrin IX monomethyl ester cyclase